MWAACIYTYIELMGGARLERDEQLLEEPQVEAPEGAQQLPARRAGALGGGLERRQEVVREEARGGVEVAPLVGSERRVLELELGTGVGEAARDVAALRAKVGRVSCGGRVP